MAGWRLVVRELYERGPLRARDLRPSYSKDAQRNVGSDLRRAAELGLLTLPGRCGVHAVYRLTPSGIAFAQGKLEVIVPEYRSPARGGRPKGVRCVLRPTWLSALPAAEFQGGTMADDREPRKAGCSGGLGALVERLRNASHGYDEWRVQDPKDGAYCIAFSWPETMNPERAAREWLADRKARFPGGLHTDYVVACVRVMPEKDRLLLEAADELERLAAGPWIGKCQACGHEHEAPNVQLHRLP